MSSLKGTQNAIPRSIPSPGQVDHAKLRVPEGPWNEDQWVLIPHSGDVPANTRQPCRVPDCRRPPHKAIKSSAPIQESLCYAHCMQWYRDGRPMPIEEWTETCARKPLNRPTSRPGHEHTIDFTVLPEPLATEIRFAAGTKLARGDWTENRNTRNFLECLIDTAVHHGARSFLERDLAGWDLLLRQRWHRTSYDSGCGPYLKTFYATLTRGLVTDPWAEDRWLWKGCFDAIVGDSRTPTDQANLRWDQVEVGWLRDGAKRLAKDALLAHERKWNTIVNWVRALRVLAEYLVQEGIDEPSVLDREVFLDFLGWVREHRGSKHNLMGVNTTASVLESLYANGIVPKLGAQVYLRRGENSVRKPRNPKPYPQDVITGIDEKVITDPVISPTVRAMLRFARWSGPRISELINLPVDILRHNPQGGYWVEYWMTKTDTWRRFPVPDDLAATIRQQQEFVRAGYGDDAAHLFPGSRSKPGPGVTMPWSASGLRSYIKALFAKHGLTKSALTGEAVTGGEIHRYRHTVGTALLNNNWSQPEVQEFLGHLSATMTSHYAKITDDTLARKAADFHRQQNHEAAAQRLDPKVERLRGKFSVVLPNGGCTLPSNMKCEFRPNPCLGCSFFQPEGEGVRETNEAHRIRLKTLVAEAHEAGDQAVVDLNQPTLDQLDQLLGHDQHQEDPRA